MNLLPVLFRRSLDRHQMAFALGEALAHLHYLMGQGALTRVLGSDGVNRFIREVGSSKPYLRYRLVYVRNRSRLNDRG